MDWQRKNESAAKIQGLFLKYRHRMSDNIELNMALQKLGNMFNEMLKSNVNTKISNININATGGKTQGQVQEEI